MVTLLPLWNRVTPQKARRVTFLNVSTAPHRLHLTRLYTGAVSSFQRGVQCFVHLESLLQDLVVRPAHFCPSFEDQIQQASFGAPELFILRSEEHTSELQS